MRISDSEMEIMEIIWRKGGEVTSAEVTDSLKEQWKPTTVQTFLKRLSDKGVLEVRKEGKTNFYTAAISTEDYKREQTEDFLRDMHKGSVKSLLASLIGGRKVNKEELTEIKDWFETL